MHGFSISSHTRLEWSLSHTGLIHNHTQCGQWHIERYTLPKFLEDKLWIDTADLFIALEGVILNTDELCSDFNTTWQQLIPLLYRTNGPSFVSRLRGSFCGVVYDKTNDTLFVCNDQIGSKMLFYTSTDGSFCLCSDLHTLSRNLPRTEPDNIFIGDILDKGYATNNHTFIQGVHRLMAGEYLMVRGTTCSCHSYHHFDNTPHKYDEATMLAETDRLFRQAVHRVLRKNEQAHLRHFFPLSGGLDSRMCQWIAHNLATAPIINFTYSQSGHYDHLLPQEISRYLGNQWVFFPLDGGNYITDIDTVCADTDWMHNYMRPVEIDYYVRSTDWQQVGVVLTGVNGDNILSADVDNRREIDRLYTLGFNANSLGSPLVLQHVSESYSPFCDVDLLSYVMHIPTAKRRNYQFYDRWILTYYPEAAQWHHKYESIGHRHSMLTIMGRHIQVRDLPRRIFLYIGRHMGWRDQNLALQESMNPYDLWVQQNPHIMEAFADYYTRCMPLVQDDEQRRRCEHIFRQGSIMEKGKVLTILSALQHLFHN